MTQPMIFRNAISPFLKFIVIPTLVYSVLSSHLLMYYFAGIGTFHSGIDPIMIIIFGAPPFISDVLRTSMTNSRNIVISVIAEMAFMGLFFYYLYSNAYVSIQSHSASIIFYYGNIFIFIFLISLLSILYKNDLLRNQYPMKV